MDISVVVTSITVMGLLMLIGSLFAYKVHITEETKHVLIQIIINVGIPSIILNGVFKTESMDLLLNQVYIVFGLSIVFHTIALFVSWMFAQLFRFESIFAKKMAILSAFGNTGFIGIPICTTLFGPTGGLLAAIFDAGIDIVFFTIVVFMLQSGARFDIRQFKSLLNLPVLAIVVGLSIAFIGYEPPAFVKQLTGMLSGLVTPLAMLYTGMLLPPLFQQQKMFFYPQIGFPLAMRLLIIPIMTMLAMSVTPFDPLIKNLITILSAMPTLMMAAILFSRYTTGDEDKAVLTTVYSTLLSLLTLPFISLLVVWWGLI